MNKYLFTLILLSACFSVSAQTIGGRVSDQTTKEYLAAATVSLEGQVSQKSLTDQQGHFSFSGLNPGKYTLKVSHLGYEKYLAPLEISRQDTVLAIFLQRASNILPEIQVISASRRAASVLDLPYALSIVNQPSQSATMPRSTPEALTNVPGVFVQKTNPGGGSAFVRGLTGNQTLILIDGIRMNNSTFRYGPNQYLNTVDPFTIQRIEVLRGSGSVQYGSDALGGVIQVLTKVPAFTAQRKLGGSVHARYWSADMEKTGSGELNYSSSRLALSAIASVKDFGDLVGGDTTGRQSPSGYVETGTHFKGKWKISETAELSLANQFVIQKNVDVFHKVRLEDFRINEMGFQKRNLSYLKLKLNNANPFFQQLNLTGSLNFTGEERNSLKNSALVLNRETDKVRTSNVSLELFSVLTKQWTANSGTEFYHDRIRSTRQKINQGEGSKETVRGLYPDRASYLNASVYSIHHLTFGRFNIEAGARYNRLKASLTERVLGPVEIHPAAFVVNAAVNYSLQKNHLYASFNSGYRAPNIDDLGTLGIVDFRYEKPSYGLKPEKSYNLEAGYKYAAESWHLGVSVYHNSLKNLITRIKTGEEIDGYQVYRKENTEKASIKGVEGFVEWKVTGQLIFDGFASYNYGQNITLLEPLRRMPPFNGHLALKYHLSEFYLKGEISWADDQNRLARGDMEDNRIPAGGTPGWKVFNLYTGYNLRSFGLRLSAQNLLNADYRTHGSGVNSVGRSFWTSLQYNF